MYEVGKVYIWQNQVGECAALNGTETTVLEGPFVWITTVTQARQTGWLTDSYLPGEEKNDPNQMVAFFGDLRLKDPPNGEKIIMELFKQPEMETA
jgi:hypothetical protein